MKLVRYAAALAALSLALAACGGGSSSTSTSTSSAGGGGGSGKAVDVKLADFSIDLPGGTTLAAGTYTFNVTNAGPTAHNLTINGPGVDNQATSTFTSGTQKLTVTLSNGSYDFYCSVPGHKQAGMDVNVTVGSG
jgi:plastocyanin